MEPIAVWNSEGLQWVSVCGSRFITALVGGPFEVACNCAVGSVGRWSSFNVS